MKRKAADFWAFILPALISFILVVLIPAVTGLYYSFTDWNGIGKGANFVGLKNYIYVLTKDGNFLHAFLFTFIFSLAAVICINVLGFAFAMLVTQKFKGANFLRGVFFMPNLIGGILLGFTWQFIFVSVFDAVGKTLKIDWLQGWLSNTQTGFVGMLIVITWQLAGYMMIIYIAQLQNIPESFLEAARIDGASSGQIFKKIILPLVRPAFTIGLFLSISNSFKMFDQNISLTAGGPANSTEMIALNIYNTAFKESMLGRAQAKAIIFLIIVAAISLTQLYISKKKEVEM